MVLLCTGVLIVGATIRIFAASYTITATVPAQVPTQPAVITQPVAQQHFASAQAMISGSCPPHTYVKLFRDTVFSGVSQCPSGSFQIQTMLSPGANQLSAQVYNTTDQAGPTGGSITVYYDQTTGAPLVAPSDVPTTMWVAGLDSKSYAGGTIQRMSENPTIAGWAPPWSIVTITFHSNPLTCLTQANGTGRWSCTLSQALPPGLHHVDVLAISPSGQHLTFPGFEINVQASLPNLLLPAVSSPLIVRAEYHYQVRLSTQPSELGVTLTGGASPFIVHTNWGDGTTTIDKRIDGAPFTISHTYSIPTGANKDFVVLVHATDSQGQTALMQLSVVVKGTGLALVANDTTLNQLLNDVRHWMWVIWPAYMIVVLMAIGYYLGEREEYRHLIAKKQARATNKIKRAT